MMRCKFGVLFRALLVVGVVIVSGQDRASSGQGFSIVDRPTDFDRWFYPSNTTPGISSRASLFSGTPQIDGRLAQGIFGFDTSGDVPAGLGADSYQLSSVKLAITSFIGASFTYDDTYDTISTYLDSSLDTDEGRPVVLFGAASRNGFAEFGFGPAVPDDGVFQESEPYCEVDPELGCVSSPHAFATDFDSLANRDISFNVEDGFDVAPWAIGQATEVTPGDAVTTTTTFEFEVDVSNAQANAFIRESLDRGKLFLNLSSMVEVAQMEPVGFPSFYMREGSGLPGFEFPLLDLEVTASEALTGDFNADGALDCSDIDALVAEIVAATNNEAFDLNGDSQVDPADLENWLAIGGAANLPSGQPYLVGDANLDGTVDGSDFLEWNRHKFTNEIAWCSGDFNADGTVDGSDFLLWNGNKFTSSDVVVVPEPTAIAIMTMLSMFGIRVFHRCPSAG